MTLSIRTTFSKMILEVSDAVLTNGVLADHPTGLTEVKEVMCQVITPDATCILCVGTVDSTDKSLIDLVGYSAAGTSAGTSADDISVKVWAVGY